MTPALHIAARVNNAASHYSRSSADYYQQTPTTIACRNDCVNALSALVEAGGLKSNPSCKPTRADFVHQCYSMEDTSDWTDEESTLLTLCAVSGSLKCLKWLIQHRRYNGNDELRIAASNAVGQDDCLIFLLKTGVDIESCKI